MRQESSVDLDEEEPDEVDQEEEPGELDQEEEPQSVWLSCRGQNQYVGFLGF